MGNRCSNGFEKDSCYVIVKDGLIVEVSKSFPEFTGYNESEICGVPLSELSNILRINSEEGLDCVQPGKDYFLFTKSCKAREIEILIKGDTDGDKKSYIFEEKPSTRIEDKFPGIEAVASSNAVGIFIFHVPDLVILKANDTALSILDEPFIRKENSIGRRLGEVVTGWHGSTSEAIWKTLIKTGEPFHVDEYVYDRLDRGISYWESTLTPAFENGKLKYYIEMINDITEKVLSRRQIEQQAKLISDQNKQLEAILEQLSEGLFLVDKEGNYTLVNKAARELIGRDLRHRDDSYRSVELYDMEGKRLTYNEMPSSCVIFGNKFESKKLVVKTPYKETYLSFSGTPVFDDMGNFITGVVSARDVTPNVRYEKILKEQRDLLFKIFDALELPIICLSYPQLNIIGINREASESILNTREKAEPIGPGDNISKARCNDAQDMEYIYQMSESKNTVYRKGYKSSRKGRETVYNLVYQPLFDSKNNISEVVILGVDVTNEVKEKELMARNMSMQSEFFSFISHEFKTPLTVINAAIQAMEFLCKDDLTPKMRNYIDKIRQNTLRQLRLVKNLLDITRAEAGYLKVFKKNVDIVALTGLIIDSVMLYAKEKDLELLFTSSIEKCIIGLDDEKYERILLNLLSNAIKFTPKGKRVYISMFMTEDKVCVQVKDEGIGIPEDKHAAIFNRFAQVSNELTRQSEGTGIGLALVRLLVNRLGGDISLDSQPGKGSMFTFCIPAEKCIAPDNNELLNAMDDNRLLQSISVEFSNIYMD